MPKAKAKSTTRKTGKKEDLKIEKELAKEMKDLTKEMRRLKKLDFMHVFAKPWKFMLFAFVKGLMVGLGSVIGATILVALVIYILSKVTVVPVVGDFVENVTTQIESAFGGTENQ